MGSDMRMIVGVSGATGVEMSYYLVRALKDMGNCEIHLILSEGAKVTWDLESSVPLEELTALADFIYDGSGCRCIQRFLCHGRYGDPALQYENAGRHFSGVCGESPYKGG